MGTALAGDLLLFYLLHYFGQKKLTFINDLIWVRGFQSIRILLLFSILGD